MKGCDKKDVYGDVGGGGDSQEKKRSSGISQGREDAGGNVIEEDKGQTPYVDIQVDAGIFEDFLRGVDQLKQCAAAKNSNSHQQQA